MDRTRITTSPQGAESRWPESAWVGLVLIVVVLLSRLMALPDGAWEQDEAIFSAAVLRYDWAQHRPHPPGFPGWILLGKILHPIVGDALLALRLWSCVASVAVFALLARLAARFVRGHVAVLGALLFSVLPTVWFHAPRGFSTTPALASGLLAIELWCRADETKASPRNAIIGGWLALGASVAIRPQFVVPAVLLGLGALWFLRRYQRWSLLGATLGVCVPLLAMAIVVYDTGGFSRTSASFAQHFRTSMGAVDWQHRTSSGLEELGVVRGLGGLMSAALWSSLFVLGVVSMVRGRLRALGVCSLLLVLGCGWSVLALHPPTFPRYSILLIAAMLPPVLVWVDRLPKWVGIAALLAAILVGGWGTWPALWSATQVPLAPVAALRSLEAMGFSGNLLHSHSVGPLARLERDEGRFVGKLRQASKFRRRAKWGRAPYYFVGNYATWLPGATVDIQTWADFPEQAWDLSQRRFDRAVSVRDPVVPLPGQVKYFEHNRLGEDYLWLKGEARFLVPPGSQRLHLVTDVAEKVVGVDLSARIEGREPAFQTVVQAGAQEISIPLEGCGPGACLITLDLRRRAHLGRRGLTLRLYGAWAEGPGFQHDQHVSFAFGQRRRALALGVTVEGTYAPERFTSRAQLGAWSKGKVTLLLTTDAAEGRCEVELAQSPPRDPKVVLDGGEGPIAVRAGANPQWFEFPCRAQAGRLKVVIEGEALRPSELSPEKTDKRQLGPIVFSFRFSPQP